MAYDIGTAKGEIQIGVAQALASLATLRASSAATTGSLNTIGRNAQIMGAGLAGVGAAIVAGFTVAVKKTAEFESKMSYVKGVTGATTEELERLRSKALQLGQDSAYTANEVADAFIELSKAGAGTEQIIGGMGDAVITLGQAADISLDKAATLIVGMSSTFGLASDQASRVADVIQGAANAAIISVEDLSVSMKYAGGVAANLGLSIEETATALAILGNNGIRGSTAGTSLRRIMLQLTPRTDKAAKAMEQLGIITADGANRFYDAEGNAKSFSEITEILRTSTAGLTAEMRQKAFATIFGDRAINSAIALAKDGAAGFDEMYRAVGDVSAAEVAKERLNNLAGAWEIFKGAVDTALISAGTPAQRPLMDLLAVLTKLVNMFSNLSPEMQTLIVKVLLAVAGLALLSGGFLLIFGTMLRAWAVLIQLGNAMKFLGIVVRVLTGAFFKLAFAMLTNPIGLLILGIIALGAALVYAYKRFEGFRTFVDAVWTAFKSRLLPALQEAWAFIKNQFGAAIAGIGKSFSGLKSALSGFVGLISGLFGGGAEGKAKSFGDTIKKVGTFIGELAGAYIGGLVTALGWLIGALIRVVGWLIQGTIMAITMVIGGFTALIKIVVAVVNFFRNLPGYFAAAGSAIASFASNVWNAIKSAFSAVIGFFKSLPGMIGSFLAALPGKIGAFLSQLPATIGYWIGFAIGTLVRLIATGVAAVGIWMGNMVMTIGTWLAQLPGQIWGWLQAAYVAIVTNVTQWYHAAVTWVTLLVASVIVWFQQLPGRIAVFLVQAYNWVVTTFNNMRTGAVNAAVALYHGVINWFQQLPSRVKQFFIDLYNGAVNKLRELVGQGTSLGARVKSAIVDAINGLPGLVSGIFNKVVQALKDLAGRALSAAKDFASGLWEGFKDGLGINSPSYIEEAMFALNRNVKAETKKLSKQVADIQKIGNSLPSMTASYAGAAVPASTLQSIAAASAASSGVGSFAASGGAATQLFGDVYMQDVDPMFVASELAWKVRTGH